MSKIMRWVAMTVAMMVAVVVLIQSPQVLAYIANDDYADGTWRTSLDTPGSCWTERSCNRVMTISHGGDWNIANPYDSMPAFERAYENGADCVKGDFRVSKDNIGVVMHSSPIEIYESINCYNKKVEEMTAEECTQCRMEITNITFSTAPDLLRWAENKVNVMFCVKESEDAPRAITTLVENNATHRAFLELHAHEILALEANNTPYWDKVYYIVDMKSREDFQSILTASATLRARAFLLEFSNEDWPNAEEDVKTAEAAGFRTACPTNDNGIMATVNNHLKLYGQGFDVAYTYNLTNAVAARKQVNSQNGITPP